MNDAEHTEANMGERAKALAEFARYTEVGARYMLRYEPAVVENAVKRVSRRGVEQCEAYLRSVS